MARIIAVEGIGEAYARKLNAVGIATTDAFLTRASTREGRSRLADETGISEALILRWANHVDLFRIKGIREQYAELLEAAGVDSVVELALRTARFYHHESCGKCTPCREGTNWTVKMLERMIRGEATPIDLETVASVQKNIIGNCLCVLGDSMAAPVGSMVEKFREEFDEALEKGVPSMDVGSTPRAEDRAESARREADHLSAVGGR